VIANATSRLPLNAPLRLRVLTLNAWLLRLGRFRVARDLGARTARIPEAVAATGADVVALQEVWPPRVAAVLARRFAALGYPHLVAGARRTLPRVLGDGLMILSRHPVREAGRLRFSRSSVWFEALVGKGALAADVALPGGDTLRLVTAHLGVVRYDVRRGAYRETDARTRRAQVDELAAWMEGLAGSPRHLVLAGDLNVADRVPREGGDGGSGAEPRSGASPQGPDDTPAPDYRHLLERLPLADAYREHDPAGRGFTFDPARNPHAGRGRLRGLPGQRIDYVLYRAGTGLRSQAATVALQDSPPLSDHYGLLVDFEV
jgi:endonuclease/exonuclease/phosphatase family metal-dependent hydrolase